MEIAFILVLAIYAIIFAIGIALMVHWVWMLIDCVQNEPNEGNDKVIWILVIVLAGWIGSLIYYFVRKRSRVATCT